MRQDYEFLIFDIGGAISLVVHSTHFNDTASIRSAMTFAANRPFEVWRLPTKYTSKQAPAKSTLTFRSSKKHPISVSPDERAKGTREGVSKRLSEFKLFALGKGPRTFAAAPMTDDEAAEHVRTLLQRHSEMVYAEIWRNELT